MPVSHSEPHWGLLTLKMHTAGTAVFNSLALTAERQNESQSRGWGSELHWKDFPCFLLVLIARGFLVL